MGFVYVTVSEEDRVALLSMDDASGRLEPLASFDVPGRPAPIARHPGGGFLYVGRRGDNMVSSYSVEESGAISAIGEVVLRSDPCYMSTGRRGRFLLSAYYGGAGVSVHRIGSNGAVQEPVVQWVDTATGAHCIQTDASNSFAFVPHIADKGPNAIYQFRFDEETGRLSPNEPASLTPSTIDGPRHFCFHPSLDVLYTSNEQGCSVTAYALDRDTGLLRALQTVSTLPEGFTGENSCAQIRMTPSGRFLYAPNRGHDSIAAFSVDESTGLLTAIGHTPTESVPRAFDIDPSGRFLYAAGLETGRVASYAIDQGSGALTPLDVYTVGGGPMWVLVTPGG